MKKIVTKLFSCMMVVAIMVSLCAPVISASEYEISPYYNCPPRGECN